jgi:hypothetical protein
MPLGGLFVVIDYAHAPSKGTGAARLPAGKFLENGLFLLAKPQNAQNAAK